MTTHVRKQIRDAAITALTGLTTTGANVKNSPVYPMQDADLQRSRRASAEPLFQALNSMVTTGQPDYTRRG